MSRYKWGIVFVVAVMFVVTLVNKIYSIGQSVPTVAQINTLPVIIIDPGHGGMDGGAVGVDDIVEKDINLQISLILRDLFQANGFEVVMIRTTDTSIHDEGVDGVRKQKVSDMHNRLALAEAHPGAIFISVHQNKFGDSSSKGTQIFYSPNHPGSQRLAEILQGDVVALLQPENKREIKMAGKDLYLMTNMQCVGILMECGFLSNPDEAYQLMDAQYQSKMAFVAFRSVMEYLELDIPGAGPTEGTDSI